MTANSIMDFGQSPTGGINVTPSIRAAEMPNAWVYSVKIVDDAGHAPTQAFLNRACPVDWTRAPPNMHTCTERRRPVSRAGDLSIFGVLLADAVLRAGDLPWSRRNLGRGLLLVDSSTDRMRHGRRSVTYPPVSHRCGYPTERRSRGQVPVMRCSRKGPAWANTPSLELSFIRWRALFHTPFQPDGRLRIPWPHAGGGRGEVCPMAVPKHTPLGTIRDEGRTCSTRPPSTRPTRRTSTP